MKTKSEKYIRENMGMKQWKQRDICLAYRWQNKFFGMYRINNQWVHKGLEQSMIVACNMVHLVEGMSEVDPSLVITCKEITYTNSSTITIW
jgi:hypothetical protein